jgi:uncharacterized protein YycO
VFYSPVATAGVTHGHSGIYYNTANIVEAQGPGRKNCSQVVWVAYYDGAGINLDSNGGPGVDPSDILKSS